MPQINNAHKLVDYYRKVDTSHFHNRVNASDYNGKVSASDYNNSFCLRLPQQMLMPHNYDGKTAYLKLPQQIKCLGLSRQSKRLKLPRQN